MQNQITCLVTLHGIGFQQPPLPGVDNSGYADLFHSHLKTSLGKMLSDDPHRLHPQPGQNGVIYVESGWLDTQGRISREEGLKRLGHWGSDQQLDFSDAPLIAGEEAVSHVALVYSDLETARFEKEALLPALGMALAHTGHYASVLGGLHLALADGLALLKTSAVPRTGAASLRPRTNAGFRQASHGAQVRQAPVSSSPGILTLIKTLQDDVASYVCCNEERERVRSFVREALVRLAHRSDVAQIILNTHSNGTVIAFDVLRSLPAEVTRKIKGFITAGSPLRKYIDVFDWGNQIQSCYAFTPWYNFWDPCDPVADPLDPPLSWRTGDEIHASQEKLLTCLDLQSESPHWIAIEDYIVNNVEKSCGGGLQAHNYWDNEEQFVAPLATFLRSIAALAGEEAKEKEPRLITNH